MNIHSNRITKGKKLKENKASIYKIEITWRNLLLADQSVEMLRWLKHVAGDYE